MMLAVVLSLLIQLVQGSLVFLPPSPDVVKAIMEDAIGGTQLVQEVDVVGANGTYNFFESGNSAKSVTGLANAGFRAIAGRGTSMMDSNSSSVIGVAFNIATSNQNKAVSGSQVVGDNVEDTVFTQDVLSLKNEASQVGSETGTDYTAVSGSQVLLGRVERSNLSSTAFTYGNTASNNYNGKAVAGIDEAAGSVRDSYIKQQLVSEDNFASAGDGRAVAGVQSGMRTVVDSTIVSSGFSGDNQAKAIGGNAIAGVENNFGSVSGSFPGGGPLLALTGRASNNLATARDGKAVAGVATNIDRLGRGALDQSAMSDNNKAVTNGEGEIPKLSVAGTSVVINEMDQAAVLLNLSSSGNQAFNYHYDPNMASDAVAGSQVVIGSANDAVIAILGNSTDNFALAKYGDAVAGNDIDIVSTTSDVVVSVDLEAKNNSAISYNGDAIVYSDVTIGGGATVLHNDTSLF